MQQPFLLLFKPVEGQWMTSACSEALRQPLNPSVGGVVESAKFKSQQKGGRPSSGLELIKLIGFTPESPQTFY